MLNLGLLNSQIPREYLSAHIGSGDEMKESSLFLIEGDVIGNKVYVVLYFYDRMPEL